MVYKTGKLKPKNILQLQNRYISIIKLLSKERQELRGRLEALQAKAAAKGKIEDETLTDIAQQAKKLLYSRPTPLAQAANLVEQYEKRLNN